MLPTIHDARQVNHFPCGPSSRTRTVDKLTPPIALGPSVLFPVQIRGNGLTVYAIGHLGSANIAMNARLLPRMGHARYESFFRNDQPRPIAMIVRLSLRMEHTRYESFFQIDRSDRIAVKDSLRMGHARFELFPSRSTLTTSRPSGPCNSTRATQRRALPTRLRQGRIIFQTW